MPATIKAAVLIETGAPLRIMTLEIPPLKPGQVVVNVAYSGICRTQVMEMKGEKGPDRFLPHTLGHEAAGTVTDIGPGVVKVKAGDRVVLSWLKGRGADVASTVYSSLIGPVNSGAVSTFMTQAVTCENRVTPIPMEMPLREATLLGCAMLTGAGIVLNTLKISSGASVAVWGVGGIGLSAVIAAHLVGAHPIVAVDVSDRKLNLARTLGATHAINTLSGDAEAVLGEITGKKGLDFSIEAAGCRSAMEPAFRSVRAGGGVCVIAGNLPIGQTMTIDPMDLIRGKRIVGSWGGEAFPDKDIPFFIRQYMEGKLALEKLIVSEYALDQINEGVRHMESEGLGRVLIRCQ